MEEPKINVADVRKINLGSGNRPIEGYTSVDFQTDAEVNADARHLPFSDNQLEEIVCFHMIEHLPKDDVPIVLKEAFRCLKVGGVFKAQVPDLEDVLQGFLDAPEDQRWGIRIQRIYGLQSHPGEFHQTGFTQGRFGEVFKEAGFNVKSVEKTYSDLHCHYVLDIIAVKP